MNGLFARRDLGDSPTHIVPSRVGERTGSVFVSADTALKASAVWSALRLRADLVSSMPISVYRTVGDLNVKVTTPPVLVTPGGAEVGIQEWLWSTQFELDRVGNVFGVISETDSFGLPRRIDLAPTDTVKVKQNKQTNVVTYTIDHTTYSADQIWHERQFTLPGMVMGMSPIMYAAKAIAQYQSALDFGLEWFGNGAQIPTGHLKNVKKTLQPEEAKAAKERFKSAVSSRDVFVTGSDWEYSTAAVAQNESQFLDTQHISGEDIARYFGVPGDLIDIQTGTKSAVTYASITQRNLQFLIMNLGPVFARREVALSRWLPAPRFVKFNTDALLRMDPDTRNAMMLAQLNRTRTATELRAADDLPPFTDAQLAEIQASTSTPILTPSITSTETLK